MVRAGTPIFGPRTSGPLRSAARASSTLLSTSSGPLLIGLGSSGPKTVENNCGTFDSLKVPSNRNKRKGCAAFVLVCRPAAFLSDGRVARADNSEVGKVCEGQVGAALSRREICCRWGRICCGSA